MGLRLKKDRNGRLRPYFYGRYMVDGKFVEVNLDVKWKGTPPEDLRGDGDGDFEKSREKASLKLEKLQEEAARKGRAEHLTELLIESKTGRKIEYPKLEELSSLWRAMPRSRKVTEKHLAACDSKFERFVTFMASPPRSALHMHEVKESDAGAYLEHLQKEFTDETVRQTINLLRGAFERFMPVGMTNPFRRVILRGSSNKETIHRKPFTLGELEKIFQVAERDALLFPLIVCAASTGMRRGDVCRLKWSDVDMNAGMINCKTRKTRETVEIPIFGRLRNVLETQPRTSPFVFPEAARLIETRAGQSQISWGFKYIVTEALTGEGPEKIEPLYPAEQAREDGLAIIESITKPETERRTRMTTVLNEYLDGSSYREIQDRHGYSRGQISGDLQAIENRLGGRIRRKESTTPRLAVRRATTREGEGRNKAASVRDWHALRVTFVTCALSAGIPMELVRRVTGHKTVEIVLKNYFKPDREHFRQTMQDRMPDVLTGERESEKATESDQILELARKIAGGDNPDVYAREIIRMLEQKELRRPD